MRLAVLSDIHGNLPALQAVLEDVQQFAVDGFIVAGDTATGPQVNQCLVLLRSLQPVWAVQGNNEEYMLGFADGTLPSAWQTLRQYGLVRWCFQNLEPDGLTYFRSLPGRQVIRLPGTKALCVVHGSPSSANELIFPDRDPQGLAHALEQIEEPVMICGHTHLPWEARQSGKLALNPGAVSGALCGDPRAYYKLLTWEADDWIVTQRAVDYNLKVVRRIYEDSGLLEAGGGLAQTWLRSIETGRNIPHHFLAYACQYARQAGCSDCSAIPDELWLAASQTFQEDQQLTTN